MKRVALILLVIAALAAPAWAHGNFEHVRGVVTAVSAGSITIQLADQKTKTFTLTAKSTFEKSGAAVKAGDLKVGERVIIEVPKGTTEARIIKFGPPKATAKKQ